MYSATFYLYDLDRPSFMRFWLVLTMPVRAYCLAMLPINFIPIFKCLGDGLCIASILGYLALVKSKGGRNGTNN